MSQYLPRFGGASIQLSDVYLPPLYLPRQDIRNETIDNATDARACEEEEKRPASAHLCNDEGNRPAGDLHKGAKEVALVDVALPQVGGVLDVTVVAHEPHHAVKMFSLSKMEIDMCYCRVDLQNLQIIATSLLN